MGLIFAITNKLLKYPSISAEILRRHTSGPANFAEIFWVLTEDTVTLETFCCRDRLPFLNIRSLKSCSVCWNTSLIALRAGSVHNTSLVSIEITLFLINIVQNTVKGVILNVLFVGTLSHLRVGRKMLKLLNLA